MKTKIWMKPAAKANIVFVENDPDTNQEEEVEVEMKNRYYQLIKHYMDRCIKEEQGNKILKYYTNCVEDGELNKLDIQKGGVYYGEREGENVSVPFKNEWNFGKQDDSKPNGRASRQKNYNKRKKLK